MNQIRRIYQVGQIHKTYQTGWMHRIRSIGFCLMAMSVLSGCSLALEELPAEKDQLAGIFVTAEHIEPAPPSLEVNYRGEIVVKETGPEKIYGSFNGYAGGMPVVTFPDLEGCGIYNLLAPEDETHEAAPYSTCDFPFVNLHVNVSDDEDCMTADLYVYAEKRVQYFFNPVYQQTDGQLYLLAGSGVSTDSFVDGQQFSHSISESVSTEANGEQSTLARSFTVNIIAATPPVEAELFLMDQENRPLERLSSEQLEALSDSYEPLVLSADVSYLILRQAQSGDKPDSHSLFDRNQSSLEYLAPAEEDGFLYFHYVPLEWP